ncbi:hypothetical protein CNMCM7691_007750 [Aspergillus felis]|uniref:Xylanolytic transcriptional activator regulatory domain-containing protein n=1 Tax=Aspergillus felis TaxID=1287682 RepID=A0A8H6QW17_9EURO|nr:hypothetical protein CNMCM7691_007750 [Aspergillus felis]
MSKGALAQRIEILEAQLSDITERTPSASGDLPVHSPVALQAAPEERRPLTNGRVSAYFGPSSGVTITENLSRIVEDAAWTDRSIPINDTEQQEPRSPATSIGQGKAVPPDDMVGMQLLEGYFSHMHMRLPFIDRAEILQLHARRSDSHGLSPQERYGMFKLFMVYAIGAAMLQVTERHDSTPPSAFFEKAIQIDDSLRDSISIAGIEGRMLMVLYELRSSSSSSVWYSIGLAMRICIDFGMHRETHYRSLRLHEAQLRRRLFWSVYVIERYVSWSLGRPFSIAEEEIDAQLPADTEVMINDDDKVNESANVADRAKIPTLGRFIATVRLQRIMSLIHTKIYRVDRDMSTLVPEISPLLASLEEYRLALPPLEPHEDDFIQMHWNNCIRALLQPFLSILNPEDGLIKTCLHASGQTCQFFKRLRQKNASGYSFLLVNAVFVAGLTMCFCLFRSPHLWTTSVANDLRACSSALFVMAERNPSLRKYRDGLENTINQAMDFVNEASSGSLCTPNQPTAGGEALQIPTLAILGDSGNPTASVLDSHAAPFSVEVRGHGDPLDVRNPFTGIFTEDFWTGDGFNLPLLDGFDW